MNKRARLARRILREHRRKIASFHVTREWKRGQVAAYDFWYCSHCAERRWKMIPYGSPRAYR